MAETAAPSASGSTASAPAPSGGSPGAGSGGAPPSAPSTPSTPSTPSGAPSSAPAAPPSASDAFKQALKQARAQDAAPSTPSAPQIDPAVRDQWMKEARQKFESDFTPWVQMAGTITPEEFKVAAPYLQALVRNPLQFGHALAQHLGYQLVPIGQQPYSSHGQIQQQQPPPDDEPKPDLQTADGRLLYSDQQLAKREAWREAKLMARLQATWDQQFKPFKEAQAASQQVALLRQVENKALAEVKEAEKWEGFQQLRNHMAELMRADKRVTLHSAYQRAFC